MNPNIRNIVCGRTYLTQKFKAKSFRYLLIKTRGTLKYVMFNISVASKNYIFSHTYHFSVFCKHWIRASFLSISTEQSLISLWNEINYRSLPILGEPIGARTATSGSPAAPTSAPSSPRWLALGPRLKKWPKKLKNSAKKVEDSDNEEADVIKIKIKKASAD